MGRIETNILHENKRFLGNVVVSIRSSLRLRTTRSPDIGGYMTSDKVLIIGGGPAGLEAARSVADLGGEAVLIEKRERLGGTPDRENYAKLTHHWRDASEAMAELAASVTGNPNVEVKYQAEVRSIEGDEGNFTVQLEAGGLTESLNVGAVI